MEEKHLKDCKEFVLIKKHKLDDLTNKELDELIEADHTVIKNIEKEHYDTLYEPMPLSFEELFSETEKEVNKLLKEKNKKQIMKMYNNKELKFYEPISFSKRLYETLISYNIFVNKIKLFKKDRVLKNNKYVDNTKEIQKYEIKEKRMYYREGDRKVVKVQYFEYNKDTKNWIESKENLMILYIINDKEYSYRMLKKLDQEPEDVHKMSIILSKCDDCDSFGLSGRFTRRFISEEESKEMLERLITPQYEFLQKTYNKNKTDDMLEFDLLYNEMKEDYKKLKSENKEDEFFIQSLYIREKTKYKGNHFYYTMYDFLDLIINAEENIKILRKNTNEIDRYEIFNDKKYEPLKKHVKKINYDFYSFGAINGGGISINYYFEYNEETKKWLLQYKSDLDFLDEKLEDLAFFKDGVTVFNSTTHEGHNSFMFDKNVKY